jgi:hypothetical protein
MSILCADYEAERQTFKALLQNGCQKRILLFQGKSGSGKTIDIQVCFWKTMRLV